MSHDIPCNLLSITPLSMMNVGIYISVDNMHTSIYTMLITKTNGVTCYIPGETIFSNFVRRCSNGSLEVA